MAIISVFKTKPSLVACDGNFTIAAFSFVNYRMYKKTQSNFHVFLFNGFKIRTHSILELFQSGFQ